METKTGYKCVVNYDLSLNEMIAACKFDKVCDEHDFYERGHLERELKDEGSGQVETSFGLINFDHDITSKTVQSWLSRRGLRPANLVEMLAFGAAFPEERQKHYVVELGTVWGSSLYSNGYVAWLSGHFLYTRAVQTFWDTDHYFLVVRD